MKNDLVAEVGRRFTFKAPPIGEWYGTVHCEVLVARAPECLSYTWRGGSGNSKLDTVVTWTLYRVGSGTRLKLEHSGFLPMNSFAFEALSKGWKGRLAERISQLLMQTEP
jgi:uncharacterized protein YndB with AHSA1/START domain